MLEVEDDVRAPGVQLLDGRTIQVGVFRVQRCDFAFRLDVSTDLERLIVSAPARWAVGALAEHPDDEQHRERAVAALRASGESIEGGTRRLDLLTVRIDGGGLLGSVLVLFGRGTSAFVLTPDTTLADLLAADRGRLAGILADGLRPAAVQDDPDGPDGAFGWQLRVRAIIEEFEPWLVMSFGAGAVPAGHAIVRAKSTGRSADLDTAVASRRVPARHVEPRPGFGRTVRRKAGVAALLRRVRTT
ncbi:hypothetical protein [Kineosporia sp. NBRC 101731]|uniref:hypothetical protein n=1 Tax=Kineosporia sp. NBRC 101731 TaxID=3032199 RepID=UPI0024A32DCA|nr:hypothetical protein [Kineosporia sp. NBRC 101731]GLY30542.1 hypothetical protein Kisp02_39070 [Kineosporia sp. NBRC 101731]